MIIIRGLVPTRLIDTINALLAGSVCIVLPVTFQSSLSSWNGEIGTVGPLNIDTLLLNEREIPFHSSSHIIGHL